MRGVEANLRGANPVGCDEGDRSCAAQAVSRVNPGGETRVGVVDCARTCRDGSRVNKCSGHSRDTCGVSREEATRVDD